MSRSALALHDALETLAAAATMSIQMHHEPDCPPDFHDRLAVLQIDLENCCRDLIRLSHTLDSDCIYYRSEHAAIRHAIYDDLSHAVDALRACVEELQSALRDGRVQKQ